MRIIASLILFCLSVIIASGQDKTDSFSKFQEEFSRNFNSFKTQATQNFESFRDKCNSDYAKHLSEAWQTFSSKEPKIQPKEDNPIPPEPYVEPKPNNRPSPIENATVTPVIENIVIPAYEQPMPIEPIKENKNQSTDFFTFDFYGIKPKVRMPEKTKISGIGTSSKQVANWWKQISDSKILDNALHDCLKIRQNNKLPDWAYLQMLAELGNSYMSSPNDATLLTAWLYCQSGYQMRLAENNNKLVMLYGTKHNIYNKPYYKLDGLDFYTLTDTKGALNISQTKFDGEKPLSLLITEEPNLGTELSEERTTTSEAYKDMSISTAVPTALIDFFDKYPSSEINGNELTRWAMYANTPLAEATKQKLYPTLKACTDGRTELESVNRILNWIQTGFEYEYDSVVWGHDRAFFAEETLYYPYCDCEDRAILFSRLVRDLLELDVVLVYYPNHLAAAVAFNETVEGDALNINGRRFVICDPTYIGAPVGRQMPSLKGTKVRAILLENQQ